MLQKTIKHFFPAFSSRLREVPDPRNQDMIVYPREFLLCEALLIYLLSLPSRRQFQLESKSPEFLHNVNQLAKTDIPAVSHNDTIAYYFEQLAPSGVEGLRTDLVSRLIRTKALDKYRLYGCFLFAIDGSGLISYKKRHCPHCLTAKLSSGDTIYYHKVLEAKLVTHTGFAISVASEFIENANEQVSVQDCELQAFYRLEKKLRSYFPRLNICLLLDALYACKEVFDICEGNRWRFIVSLKPGSIPTLFDEFMRLRDLETSNTTEIVEDGIVQKLSWVNEIEHGGHKLNVFASERPTAENGKFFAWVTNFAVGCRSVVQLANRGGRQRWKIENQGFNTQKNCGYHLGHAYSEDPNAAKCFYILLQIAHMLNQLMVKGSLVGDFSGQWGTLRNFARRLAESFRTVRVDEESLGTVIQIRFNSS